MKKILICLLCFCLALPVFVLPAAAETEKGRITLSGAPSDLSRGDSFTVMLELNRNPGIASVRLSLQYDKNVLTVENIEDGGALPNFSVTEYGAGEIPVFRWHSEKNLTTTGNLAKISFRVRDDAVYGESQVTASFSAGLFDIADEKGRPVEFRTEPLRFTLACRHGATVETVLKEPTLTEAGIVEERCPECGETREKELLFSLKSEDGLLSATVPPTAFPQSEEASVTVEYIYGGEEYDVAKGYFPDTLLRAFRVSFTEKGLPLLPEAEIQLCLKTEFALPGAFRLYLLTEEDGLARVDALFGGEELSFAFGEGLYLITKKGAEETDPPAALPEDLPDPSPVPDGSSAAVSEEDGEGWILAVFASLAVLFGAFAVFLLKQKKPL